MSTLACDLTREADRVFARLMVRAAGDGNDRAFAAMISTRAAGGGALPAWLGLELGDFRNLMAHHFPGVSPDVLSAIDSGPPLTGARGDEREELVELMLTNRASLSISEVWMAQVVAAGCMASDHLWQDLGLWERPELTALMNRNFPTLAERNTQDMKWKRFLYKQLCEAEGIYVCRSPSCEVCADYHVCFGPE
ncbi:nitrogen fixation protein NifQ [Imhoffiella purpurea]|uniref:Nitrogenase FeMo-cofactor synthesis molybdenum delivery protein NifQ n=1 Tax=Imhoffiella purpurea TaxID=1249627 RepID=W9V870_9GAMM|nr:nitrogen fixation protein NifQ [Imhoffiella purpurea]EXJ15773.1 Nitrogenase FeMo-cofactor synthesis molybdenum delivery protein NifQ [Imhoffiella purpurea]